MPEKINALLKKSIDYLKHKGVENSILDAQLLLGYILKVDRIIVLTNGEKKIEDEAIVEYNKLLQMRAEGTPLQYITGVQEFMSLPFQVSKDVLIPRGDTETLVEYVVEQCRTNRPDRELNNKIKAIDIGTGSGCIAVSLAYYIDNIEITAFDICERALEVATENARANGVADKIQVVKHDILSGYLPGIGENSLDIIVSNPPYIPTAVIDGLQREVKHHEPFGALDGGEDGLVFYGAIVKMASEYLRPAGILALEVGHDQSEAVSNLVVENNNYLSPQIIKDLAGIDRVIVAKHKK